MWFWALLIDYKLLFFFPEAVWVFLPIIYRSLNTELNVLIKK